MYGNGVHVQKYEDDNAEAEDRAASLPSSPLRVRGEGRERGGEGQSMTFVVFHSVRGGGGGLGRASITDTMVAISLSVFANSVFHHLWW